MTAACQRPVRRGIIEAAAALAPRISKRSSPTATRRTKSPPPP